MSIQPSIQPGQVLLGKYRVEGVLAETFNGAVVAARHCDHGELFALKFLFPHGLQDDYAVARFAREEHALAQLKGAHVVRVHGGGHLDGEVPCLVMEHLTGSTLREVLKEHGPLPIAEALVILRQVCDALTEAHSCGIVHCALSPEKLFLTRRPDGTPWVKVLAFGFSKQPALGAPLWVKKRVLVGSPPYMSPEQLRSKEATDHRSDLWSLGVVLYVLVTGIVPFRGPSLGEMIVRACTEHPAPPSQHRPELSAAFDAVVMRCLEKDPEQRFQSAEELSGALRALLDDTDVGRRSRSWDCAP